VALQFFGYPAVKLAGLLAQNDAGLGFSSLG